MIHTTGSLPPTASYPHRDYAILAGLDWPDGRDCSVVLSHTAAKTRLGRKAAVSTYAVSEVREVGFMGRTFVWDKLGGDDEHGDPRPNVPPPPYKVRIDQYGEIRCQCMAGQCRSPVCRHCDMTLVLIEEGVFDHELQGA